VQYRPSIILLNKIYFEEKDATKNTELPLDITRTLLSIPHLPELLGKFTVLGGLIHIIVLLTQNKAKEEL